MEAFIESKQAEAFDESARALALVERVAAERGAALKNAPPKTPSRGRVRKRATRAAERPGGAPRGTRAVHGSRGEGGFGKREASAGGRAAQLEAAHGETQKAERRERCDGTRGSAGRSSRRRAGTRARRRRVEAAGRGDAEGAAAAARDAAIAGLLAEVTVSMMMISVKKTESKTNDRVLVGRTRARPRRERGGAAARSARVTDASLRETFELRTQFEHAANDRASAAAAASSSTSSRRARPRARPWT